MKLLHEDVGYDQLEFLKEECGEGCKKENTYRIKGIFCGADDKNKNGRVYPLNVMTKAVEDYNENYISKRRSLSELNHPADSPEIDYTKAAIIIESLKMDGKYGMGVARVLNDLPCGKIVASLIKENIQLAMSTRGLGQLEDGGIVTSYTMLACDIVGNPSCAESFVENIIEGKEWNIDGQGNIVEMAVNNLKTKVDKKYNSKIALQYMMEFINEIQNKR